MRRIPLLESPVVLAPIAGPATPDLTAAAANAGAFGFLASAYSTPEQILAEAARVRQLTGKPFGINLFIESPVAPLAEDELREAYRQLEPYLREVGLEPQSVMPQPPQRYQEQIEAVLAARPAAFSFIFGIPDAATLARFRDAGIYTIGTATTVDEAAALEAAGVDAVCAQGSEAGGHRGAFLADAREHLIGTLALVPQVVDAVALPVIAAGGITDGREVAAVLTLGASAAQCGTAFLLADEAQTSAPYRKALQARPVLPTMLTAAFSGRPARGLRNRMSVELDPPSKRAPYPYQNALTRALRMQSAKVGNAEFLSLWAGQSFMLAREEPAAEIVTRLLREAHEALAAATSTLSPLR